MIFLSASIQTILLRTRFLPFFVTPLSTNSIFLTSSHRKFYEHQHCVVPIYHDGNLGRTKDACPQPFLTKRSTQKDQALRFNQDLELGISRRRFSGVQLINKQCNTNDACSLKECIESPDFNQNCSVDKMTCSSRDEEYSQG